MSTAPVLPLQSGRTGHSKIRVVGLRKVFPSRSGPVVALEDVNLEVEAGEFVTIVGPSGCGKTTLLRILGGLEVPTAGEVTIRHEDPAKPLQTIMFQDSAVFPWLTVQGNVEYGLRLRGVPPEVRARVAQEFLDKVGLAAYANLYPHQLSGGMRQRVSMARTFANDPEVLLMDEPFSALDEPNKVILYEELLRIWEESRKTVLFITHNLEEAIVLSDRVVVMSARPGRIKATFRVPFPRPRSVYELKRQPEFGQLAYQVWSALYEQSCDGVGGG